MTGELRKDTQKQQNMKQKHPLRFGILNHFLLLQRGLRFPQASACIEPQHRHSSLPSVCKAHLHEESFCPTGGHENVTRKHSVAQRGLQGMVGRKREPETRVFLSDRGQVTELMHSVNEHLSAHYCISTVQENTMQATYIIHDFLAVTLKK